MTASRDALLALAESAEAITVDHLDAGQAHPLCFAIAGLDFYREEHGDLADEEVPDFLNSLDAAITLAPDLLGFELSVDQNDRWHCELSIGALGGDGEARAASKALAVVAASLRALAEQAE